MFCVLVGVSSIVWVVDDVNVGWECVFFAVCFCGPYVVFVVVVVDVCVLL